MVFTVWLVVLAGSIGLLAWAMLTGRAIKHHGLDQIKPDGLDTLQSSIRWYAIFSVLALLCAGMLNTSPLLTSMIASEASIVTALTGVEVATQACCEGSQDAAIADKEARSVAGIQSFGSLALAVVFTGVSVVLARKSVARVKSASL